MKANSLILSSSELEAIKLEAQKIQERLTVLETANPPANPEADGTYSFTEEVEHEYQKLEQQYSEMLRPVREARLNTKWQDLV